MALGALESISDGHGSVNSQGFAGTGLREMGTGSNFPTHNTPTPSHTGLWV